MSNANGGYPTIMTRRYDRTLRRKKGAALNLSDPTTSGEPVPGFLDRHDAIRSNGLRRTRDGNNGREFGAEGRQAEED